MSTKAFYKAGQRAAKDSGEAGKVANVVGTKVLQEFQAAYDAWESANDEDPVTFSGYFEITSYLEGAYQEFHSLGKGDSSAPFNSIPGILWRCEMVHHDAMMELGAGSRNLWMDDEWWYLIDENGDHVLIEDELLEAQSLAEETGEPQPIEINGKEYSDPIMIDADTDIDDDLIYRVYNERNYDPGMWFSDYGGAGGGGFIEYGICAIKEWIELYANGELVEQGYEEIAHDSC